MTSPRVKELIRENAEFAKTWSSPFTMKQMREVLTDPVICLTCMDPRVVPEQFLGSHPMIAVFRNAGGRATPDVVRTINTLQSLAYKVQKATVMVVHHTDCGMTHLTDEGIKKDILERGIDGAEGINFGCFRGEDIKKSVLDDVQTLKAERLLKDVEVRGFVLTTETGLLEEL
ncbi:uncharacterized protein Z520_00936 [Fonsecaea multimorphosa CBS 102226]|uniref:Carbonic anhydrase n=1 Tax=Fonsecaea multimorphosa CBS 102226 TaxID=1442371 RepID=A0A0D2J459_9EURO|nr:uncharacterized protein Z520_00936 [Fonsecaea multimorphosa CBS 102226]KIY04242.1 hypothetical protein Z520_00936 [Fonsecaea multimorphosa CBS 102226]